MKKTPKDSNFLRAQPGDIVGLFITSLRGTSGLQLQTSGENKLVYGMNMLTEPAIRDQKCLKQLNPTKPLLRSTTSAAPVLSINMGKI